jgi:hypothetical protein
MTLDRNVLTECKLEQATDFPGNEHGLALHPQARRFPRGYSFTGLMSVGMAFRPSMACCMEGRITRVWLSSWTSTSSCANSHP